MQSSNTEQIKALLKKNWIRFKRTKNVYFQELFGPLISIYLVWLGSPTNSNGASFAGPLAIPVFLSRSMVGLVFSVVQEKSENFKEYLRVNGASLYSYMISIFIFYFIKSVIAVTIFYVGVLIVGVASTEAGNIVLGYVNLILYAIALINFALALTTIFSSPRLIAQVSSILILLLTFVYYPVSLSSSVVAYYFGSLLPPVAAVLGFSISGINQMNHANFGASQAVIMQIVNCFLYLGIYIYLDSVVPSDNGIKDPIIKCKKRSRKPLSQTHEMNPLAVNGGVSVDPLLQNLPSAKQGSSVTGNTDVSSAEHHEPFNNPFGYKRTVFIENLTKVFGESVAVDRVTMPMFERQVFCLLGHNGAGKTTTINLMTGLLRADGGGIFYDDEDFSDNFEAVRRKFGLCVQKDILYDNLTVGEHIELIARLRGININEMPNYIAYLSNKVGIRDEIDKQASTLSGGNKRKLSLALAIAGETKVIFLDEPTSGLDPNARRNFWTIVRNLKEEGKTILLTTHNLDEADELADRIAILSKGKLLILGTSNYLKKKYGVGYNLVLTPKPHCVPNFIPKREALIHCVKSIVHTSELDSKTAPEMIKMTLPYVESEKFAELFKVLESDPMIEVALELNTLEDVFVNIGLQEEAAEHAEDGSAAHAGPEEIPVPPSLNAEASFKFGAQIAAMFKRRFLCTFRNRTNVMQIVIPLLYVILVSVITGQYNVGDGQVYFFSITSMMGFLINTVSYTALPVMERELRIKYILRTIGLRPMPYWIGTLSFDAIIISIYGILLIPIGYIFKINIISTEGGNFLLIILGFGFAVVNLSYLLSWLYDKQATVYRFHILLLIFGFFYLPFFLFLFLVAVPEGNGNENQTGPIAVFAVGCVVSPPMVFLYACFSLAGIPVLESIQNNIVFFIILFCQGIFYFIINMLIEQRSLRLSVNHPKTLLPHFYPDQIPNPQEITGEATRAEMSQNDAIKAVNLQKTYDTGFQALRGVTFGVEKRQIFGLLGPNGAGKSTTFNILTGLIPRTDGQVLLNNHELTRIDPNMFQRIGICPQFDALWEHLTVKEHLEVMGAIKGLDKQATIDALDYYTRVLRMQEHMNKKSNQLSGGTKRKLCVANMLVGSPLVQFMDEPSTGLDPLSKRSLYDTVVRNLEDRNASIVLTTHSMSEAEALCSKIGILINGKFVCMGTLPYLKSRYGTGYKISIVKENSNPQVYERAILEMFPTAVLSDENSEIFDNYKIQEFSFEKAFVLLEDLKKAGHISDFNIMNTTLEQVFIAFSRNQVQAPEGLARS